MPSSIVMEEADGIALLVPHIDGQETILISDTIVGTELGNYDQQRHNTHSLIQVIEKLSKIVQTEKSKRPPLINRKRSRSICSSVESTKQVCDPAAKVTKLARTYPQETDELSALSPFEKEYCPETYEKITCYQCSLCKNILASFLQLKQHLKEHGRPSGMVMCSQCCFMTEKYEELEAHSRSHAENIEMHKIPMSTEFQQQQCVSLSNLLCSEQAEKDNVLNKQGYLDCKETKPWCTGFEDSIGKRKWYTYEQYGMYRCLICSYTCGQQRMLKTHAWKHAGEVDCSYPIFEEECESACLPDSVVPHADETILVLSSEQKQFGFHDGQPIQIQVCNPELVCKVPPKQPSTKDSEVLSQSKAPTPTAEIVVEEEAISDLDQEIPISDSLLSSAQKIISCSPNKAGHLNVIVERLPSAEENVSQKHFVINADTDPEKNPSREHHTLYEESPETYQIGKGIVQSEEVVVEWDDEKKALKSNDFSQVDENAPPIRRRTNSESLRLHSLAAEALVTMPIRVAELTRANFKTIGEVRTLEPDTGQEVANVTCTLQPTEVPSAENPPEDLTEVKQSDTSFVGLQPTEDKKSDLTEVPAKMGISMSLLTVIEKLRERTDQNASDEDILKELLDNAQCQASSDAILPGGNLVEYIPNAERPYRCRLCHYSSGNKGYLKQHLRVHRQRQPYQCPICEHIAADSKGLESHMINHCKTRMYNCKQCEDAFYYKSQLRNHEREQHLPDGVSTESPVSESTSTDKGAEEKSSQEGEATSVQKVHRCDICAYTSTTYVGVRNHRRIHSSEKPYRCSSCDFATTNMNSLKCHMRRHPQDHKAKQLSEQYKCSLCGYVCSHPPSLKSHMWKHASDQNYNYEQMNKAINEAISQSTRFQGDPQIRTFVEAISETACTVGISDKTVPCAEVTNQTVNGIAEPNRNLNSNTTRNSSVSLETNLGPPQVTGMEYVLLFCCCICGFESTSKGHLIDHMKEHEGEIINIIRNKDQNSPSFQSNTSSSNT